MPVDRPENVQKIKTTKTYIFISWDEVQSNEQNGEIQSYEVNYTSLGERIADPVTKTVLIPYANLTGLVPSTKYKVTVLASNANGDGPRSDAVTLRTRTDSKFESVVFNFSLVIIISADKLFLSGQRSK